MGKVARGGNVGGFGGRLRGVVTWEGLGEGQVTRSENMDYFGGAGYAGR